jgi:hypothetical protein
MMKSGTTFMTSRSDSAVPATERTLALQIRHISASKQGRGHEYANY